MRARLWSRLASRYLREPNSPYGPGHMSQPAFVEMTSSSRYGRRSFSISAPERLLGGAVRRAVVVREVEVRDAEVEGAAHDRAAVLERPLAAEVLPQPERDRGQLQAAAPAAPVGHAVVAVVGGDVCHEPAER